MYVHVCRSISYKIRILYFSVIQYFSLANGFFTKAKRLREHFDSIPESIKNESLRYLGKKFFEPTRVGGGKRIKENTSYYCLK